MFLRSTQKSIVGDRWLSETAGFDCFNVTNTNFASSHHDFPNGLITAKLDLSNRDTPERIRQLTGFGFRAITFQVLLSGMVERSMALERNLNRGGLAISTARNSDQKGVVDLAARAFSLDRFHADPLIPRKISDRVKGAWVESFFRGKRGTSLTVAKVSGTLCGFLLTLESRDEIVIDLIAVDQRFQGQGIASKLLAHQVALRSVDQLRISAGTQLSNQPSLNLYRAWGLEEQKQDVVLHRVKGLE